MSDIKKIQCSKCFSKTSHALLYKTETTEHEKKINNIPEIWTAYGYYYLIYECQGCHNVVMGKQLWSTESDPRDYDESYISWHPPLTIRVVPDWRFQLVTQERELLEEVFNAVNYDNKTLALMGLRAVLDMYLVRKVGGDKGNFKQKLEKLKGLGLLSTEQIEILDSVIDAGNAAAHRGYKPTSSVLLLVLDIVEIILRQDLIKEEIPAMTAQTPQRNNL